MMISSSGFPVPSMAARRADSSGSSFWQIAARHMAQRVDQHEPVFVPRLGQRVQKRLDQRPGLLSSQEANRLWQMVLSELEMRSACLLEIL